VTLEQILFGVVFVVALGASLAMLFAPNAVHVALFLVATQVSLAVAFLLQGAFFIAAIQIILYAGAIMVLFLFVIMLLGVDRPEILHEPLPGQRPLAVGLGALLGAQILYVAYRGVDFATSDAASGARALDELNRDPGNVKAIANLLFGSYLLPFEETSVLLVVAIVGVMVLARRLGSITAVESSSEAVEEEAA
jgi:NADH-quinone oxidoreductase subunit J